jgi:hypothetical protein
MSSEEVLPEKGTAKSLASRYKEFSDKAATAQVSERKRELTPDKTGKVEYISEPRSTLEKFQPWVDFQICHLPLFAREHPLVGQVR